MITHDKSCRYSKEIEKQLLQAGYKIYVNGERLTSRSLSGTGKDE